MTTPALMSRAAFIDSLRQAIQDGGGWATGKLGASEVVRLAYSVNADRFGPDALLVKAMKRHLIFHGFRQSGLFPPDPAFYLQYNRRYVSDMRELDCLGVFPELLPRTLSVLEHYSLGQPLVHYLDQEPYRGVPWREDACYLPLFAGRRILLLSPFAELLRERATRTMFEQVWAKTGARWFEPASVDALEFPYGYVEETQRAFADSLALCAHVKDEMRRRDFDVALIAAAGIAIPLAAHARRLGRVAISLGGHLQVLFGVQGKRWLDDPEWQQRYVTPAWIRTPERYWPPDRHRWSDGGAYW